MRIWSRVLGASLALAVAAAPASANLLVNGSFEDQSLNGWVRKDRALNNSWDFPTNEAQDGQYAARFVEGGFSENQPNGAVTQMVTFAQPFTGDLTVSGWVKRYVLDSSNQLQAGWGWVAVAIYVDGEHGVDPATSVPVNKPADDVWTYFEVTLPVTGISQVDVAMGFGHTGSGAGQWKNFDAVLMDGWSVVPEPATLVLLGLGALPLLRRRRA